MASLMKSQMVGLLLGVGLKRGLGLGGEGPWDIGWAHSEVAEALGSQKLSHFV